MVCYVVGLIFIGKEKPLLSFIGCLKHPVYLGSACDPDFSFGLPDVIVLSSLFGRTLFLRRIPVFPYVLYTNISYYD